MPKTRSWTDEELITAVATSVSYRAVLRALNLAPAGGNYSHVKARIKDLGLNVSHFTGQSWNRGWKFDPRIPKMPLSDILVVDSTFQSHKLKQRLYEAGFKTPKCELCGWCEASVDSRVPVELDHINGVHSDNRIENLRILCPNCHSLQSTHRGKNKRAKHARVS